MMCEPKLSMEVSKETWVCSTEIVAIGDASLVARVEVLTAHSREEPQILRRAS